MTKKDIEQVILVAWTFIITILDLINFAVYDKQQFQSMSTWALVLTTVLSAFAYYFIGWVILSMIHGIGKLLNG